MANPLAILGRVNRTLRKYTPLDRTAYKRTISRTGGDDLLGRPGVVTNTDTLLDPQPVFTRIEAASVATMLNAGSNVNVGDYEFLFSTTSITVEELQNPDLLVVLISTAGVEETFRLVEYVPASITLTDIVIGAFMRSTTR